jgi:hypothetical protein
MRIGMPRIRTRSRRPPGSSVPLSRSPDADAALPEWMTEEWKHRVEADARARLKKSIRGVGARR